MSRTHLFTAIALLVAGAIGFSQLGSSAPAPAAPAPPPAIAIDGAEGSSAVLVHVAGAVRRPGVYRLREGMRVDDAVRLAGGTRRRADLSAVNLAAKVEDGRQVVVPERPRPGAPAAGGAGPPGAEPAGPLNLNTATLEQLDALDGIGPGTAQKILEQRAQSGGFGSVEELGQIPGIGEKRLATLRQAVTV